jgi:hypothetical protein
MATNQRKEAGDGREIPGPELIIGSDADGVLSEAVCSLCGEKMPHTPPPLLNSKRTIATFNLEFQSHLQAKHPQLAAD